MSRPASAHQPEEQYTLFNLTLNNRKPPFGTSKLEDIFGWREQHELNMVVKNQNFFQRLLYFLLFGGSLESPDRWSAAVRKVEDRTCPEGGGWGMGRGKVGCK